MNDENSLALVPPTHVADLPALMQLATQLVPTGMLPDHIKTPGQAVAIILSGRELGIGPMLALRSIYMVKGKIELSADLQLSLFKRDGGQAEFKELNETRAILKLKHPNGDEHVESFNMDDAKRAMLGGDNWKKYPKAMLRSRVITAGLKSLGFEPKMSGCYAPGEVGGPEFVDVETVQEPPKAPEPAPKINGGDLKERIALFTKWLYDHVGADVAGWAIPYLRTHTADGNEKSSALMPNEDLTALSEVQLGAIRKDIAGFLKRLGEYAETNKPKSKPSDFLPDINLEDDEKYIIGTIEEVSTKEGTTGKRKWLLWSIKAGDEWFNTFSNSVGNEAERLKGQTATIAYLADDKGKTATAIKSSAGTVRAGESKE